VCSSDLVKVMSICSFSEVKERMFFNWSEFYLTTDSCFQQSICRCTLLIMCCGHTFVSWSCLP